MDMTGELVKALIAAKKAFKPLVKNKENPHFKSKYADLSALHEAVDDALQANGFAVSQPMGYDEKERYGIWTKLMHTGGESLASFFALNATLEPQKLGSAITYGRRFSLASLLGIPADDDDDGNATVQEQPAQKPKEYKLKPVVKPAEPAKEPLVVPDKAQEGMESALVQILQVSQKVQEGVGRGGATWKRFSVKIKFTESGIESWASTFSETANAMAEKYRNNGLSLLMNYKETQKGDVTYINVEDFTEVSHADA
jgi:hypothetical protein